MLYIRRKLLNMQLTIGSKITAVYIILLLFLCVFGVIILLNVLSVSKLFTFVVEHDTVVMANARKLSKLVVDMESGERGFCITQNEDFLKPYEKGVKEFKDLMKIEKELVSDNPSQVKRLENIEELVGEWQTKAATPEIAMARKVALAGKSADYLQDVLRKDTGKEILNNMRKIMDEMVKSFKTDGNVRGELLVESIAKAMTDQEAGQRGYLVTGKETFLQAYETGKEELENTFKALNTLVANAYDRKVVSRDLDELERLSLILMTDSTKIKIDTQEKLNKVTETEIEPEDALLIDKSRVEMENTVRIDYGKKILDDMLRIIDNMETGFSNAENENGKILAMSIAKSLIDQEARQRGYIITGNKTFLESYKRGQESFKNNIKKLRLLNQNAYNVQTMENNIVELENLAQVWRNEAAAPEIDARKIMSESPETIKDIAYLLRAGTGKKILDQVKKEFDEFIEIEQNLTDKRYAEATKAADNTRNTIVILIALSVTCGGIASFFITKGIVQPIIRLKEAAINIGKGDLNQTIDVRSNDEIGELALCFDKMTKALAEARGKLEQEKIKLEEQKIELEKANVKLGEMDKRKSAFVSNVSHEFRSPLAKLKESIALFLDGSLGTIESEQKEMLNLVKNNLERLIRMVRDLLDISKIEAGKMDLIMETFDVAGLVNEILKTYEKEISNKEITLEKYIPEDIGSLCGDRDKLTEVMLNLLDNAIKYTPKGGIVSVKLVGSDSEIYFEIFDNGREIPREAFHKIFDKFERITAERQEGTGLGLPIAKDIVELHKGKIWVESPVSEDLPVGQQGSKFVFTLPRNLEK